MSYKIVIVEDEKVALRLLERTLKQAGFEVFTACDGSSGLKIIRDQIPAIVISDILIPVIDGLELTKIIKKDPKLARIKVVLMSAIYKGQTYRTYIYESGADYFVEKPLDMKKLLDYLKEILLSVT
jgi:DNA-binding response OmpR family regulator